ncbi:MAG: beta-ketoacyl-[acyl-carrier-protein] synthase family protein [Spirochaetota bacterium]|nr:beta-ketoacyl-[acyl-carrier-protein] synthase family protein [Spirochaetota bacterium]
MLPDDKIVVSAYEMITPLGKSAEESYLNIVEGHSGVKSISRFDTTDIDVHYAGQVSDIDFLEYDIFTARELKNWFSPVISHSLLVAHKAIQKSGLEITEQNSPRIAVTFSSAIGGLDAILLADQQFNAFKTTPHPFTNVNVCLNLIAGKISMFFKTQGAIFAPVAACATGNVSVTTGAMLIRQNLADVVICGAVDFPLVKSIVVSFSAMNGAFNSARETDRAHQAPDKVSRPFSQDRKGFVISEGAACLVLTSKEYARKHNMPIEAEIKGMAMNSDGYHYVFPKTETTAQCVKNAIHNAQINTGDIDHVNAHAASTKIGDANEIEALKSVFGSDFHQLPLCANKSQIGHTMGASSAIELILSILALKNGVIYPTLNYIPDPDFLLENVFTETQEKKLTHVINNSFGFGGTNCCIVLGRP